ncbi:MAG TPA: S26 family signal peptidase [Puia sp.]|nr:S26 family signal peptidase [Puia sp.]
MSTHQVVVLIIIQLALLLLPAPGLALLFRKAGEKSWKAYVPFYNTWIIQELAARPKHWVFWQLVPIMGWFITMGIYIEFVKTFGKFAFWEHTLASLLPVIYFPALGADPKTKYLGPAAAKKYKKTKVREWVDAGIFAIVAATLIRTFVFEAYVIPSGSMEKTLLVNDYLFVSKFAYGPRIPMTPLSIPFVHNTLPFGDLKSYVEWIKLPYIRWFPSPVKRGDVVVFNLPIGDTVINTPDYQSLVPYYQAIREAGGGNSDSGRQIVLDNPDQFPLVLRPVDKEENYIKRCVGIPGDTLQVKDHVVYIDGIAQPLPPESETWYVVKTRGQSLDEDSIKKAFNFDIANTDEFRQTDRPNEYRILLTYQAYEKMIHSNFADSIGVVTDSNTTVYPYSPLFHWSVDNYGPIFLPKRGSTITLTPKTYAIYQRAIRVYEHNDFETRNGKYYLNGQEVTRYTFKGNYYWMMGDNRHDSQDARYWGFVPEQNIVGKASLIWMSWGQGQGIRWKRLFTKIR